MELQGFPSRVAAFPFVRLLDFAARGHAHSLTDEELKAACQHVGPTLQALDISGAFLLSAAGLQAALGRCTALRRLECSHATATVQGLASLPCLGQLESLTLRGCMFLSEALLSKLTGLTALRSLDLAGCGLALHLNPPGAAALAALTQLTQLDLGSNGVDDNAMQLLAELPALRQVGRRRLRGKRSCDGALA